MNSVWKDFRNPVLTALTAVLVNFSFIAFSRRTAEVSPQFGPLNYVTVGLSTALAAFMAYTVLKIFKEYTERPEEYFLYTSGIVLVSSFGLIGHLAVGLPMAGVTEINVLGTLHVITAVVVVAVLLKLEQVEE